MRVIDFHTHVFPPDIIRERKRFLEKDDWFRLLYADPTAKMADTKDLIASMGKAGVEVAVTFGFAWDDPGLCQLSNDYVAEAVRCYPERLVGYAVVNPRFGPLALREAERCAALGFRGIGELMPDGQGYDLDDTPTMGPLLSWSVEQRIPILVHTNEPVGHVYHGKGNVTPPVVYRLAQCFPEMTLICAHWGGGLPFYELMPEVRQALKNVYYDTAASLYLYDREIFSLAAQFVKEKILFATDYPLLEQRRFLRHVRAAGLAPDDLERILGGNAQHLLS